MGHPTMQENDTAKLTPTAVWKYGSYIISNIRLNNSITQMNWRKNWSEFVVMKRPRTF